MAINWANEASINQIRPAGHRRISMVDIDGSGASTHTVTGIPSDAAEVNIHMINFSQDGSSSGIMRIRCGNGSMDSGSNYNDLVDNSLKKLSNLKDPYLICSYVVL